jgi:hypothetical protein
VIKRESRLYDFDDKPFEKLTPETQQYLINMWLAELAHARQLKNLKFPKTVWRNFQDWRKRSILEKD